MDSVFLSLETPSTPMHLVGLFLIDPSVSIGGYSFEGLLRLVEERAHALAPLRRRLVRVPFELDQPVWVDDPDLDVGRHVERIQAPAPGSQQVLMDLVARVAAQPLDRSRPLWALSVVEGLADGRVALVFKLHHAVADGVSAALLLLQLLGTAPVEAVGGQAAGARVRAAPVPTRRALLAHAAGRLPERTGRLGRLVRDTSVSLVGMAHASRRGSADGAAGMPMPFSAPDTPWNRAVSSDRVVAIARVRLEDVKRIGAVFGATVNHVVLAACTQSLRAYLESHGGVPTRPLVAAIPVSLRTADEPGTYGNRLTALLVHLPVHLADPTEQLLALGRAARSAKAEHAHLGIGALGGWAEFGSATLLGAAARLYSSWKLADRHRPLHNLVISNVHGPAAALCAAGAPLTAAHPLGPPMEGVGLNVTVMSYAGSVDFGVVACGRLVPDVAELAVGFERAVAALLAIALVAPAASVPLILPVVPDDTRPRPSRSSAARR